MHHAADDPEENIYKKTLEKMQTTGDRFTDDLFLPNANSLINDWNDKSKIVREIIEERKQI